ncbi:MAG TPA: MFS transporter [Steroidobacteraceae bacterium]|nr:MFS transporter [Steroidobacteraceae bacterium]
MQATKPGESPRPQSPAVTSPRAPFRHPVFTVLWVATLVSNIGNWMYNAATAWLMMSLDTQPLIVSLVQVASSLPLFLLALPAGALADIVDKRRLLIVIEVATTVIAAIFALLVGTGHVTPVSLLLFMFLEGALAALSAPAYQAIVPQLVPRQELIPAVAANSVGINISRAIGPALGGALIGLFGIVVPFWLDAVSNLGVIGALLWWRIPRSAAERLPAERLLSSMRTGVRYAHHSRHVRATLIRAAAFFLFASAYWALLPLVARTRIAGGPEIYGILLGTIGAGALGGAFLLPKLKAKLGPDGTVRAGTLGTAAALVLFGLARQPIVAVVASALAGASWIGVLANLNVSAQMALPDWVRGRGLALYVTVFFGAMTLGSALWGEVAGIAGLPLAHFIAAAGAALGILLTRRWKLQTGAKVDFAPSMHWPAPIVSHEIEADQGPVMVTIEYHLASEKNRQTFLEATERLSHQRRRDGAYAWGVFEDTAERGKFVETFLVESWLEHLRQHQRVTKADRALQEHIHQLLSGAPTIRHFISAEADPG